MRKNDFQFSGRYQPAVTSETSLTGGITYEHPKFHLYLMKKTEPPSERPIIHSTKWERLSYYRSFTTASEKSEIIATQHINLNKFVWFYAFNTLFKSLPHGFVHMFIAAYAPEEHMFVTKMVPFNIGLKYLYVFTGFLEVISSLDAILLLWYYVVVGLVFKSPWNRCHEPVYFDHMLNYTVHCYDINEFAKKFINSTNSVYGSHFLSKDNEIFQVAQIEYYRLNTISIMTSWNVIVFFMALWSVCVLLSWQVTKSFYWKILHRCHWMINAIDLIILLYISLGFAKLDNSIPISKVPQVSLELQKFWAGDLEMLAESITAPPIVHVLTARSTQKIYPTQDSAVMIISNALIYVFRGILGHVIKTHCERLINTEIPVLVFNQHSWYYMYPMFYSSFYLGDIFIKFYLILKTITDTFVISVTYRCLVESVVYEWPKIKRWLAALAATVYVGVLFFVTNVDSRTVLWIYSKGMSTLMEIISVYVMYPVGRLIDDYAFHFGQELTKLRILSFRLVPVYYLLKLNTTFSALWNILELSGAARDAQHYKWSWALTLVPVILGSLYIIYKYLVVYKMTWTHIFRPLPQWGPRDFVVRQLRKQFDSRFYIGSEVPRLLNRYLMNKKASKIYKIDVRYDIGMGRRSTIGGSVRFGDNRKDKES